MWHTNNGDRTLAGAEARLFAEALWDFVQELEVDEGDYDVALPVFDRLTYGQKASHLSIAGKGLLTPQEPIYKLTAVVECAVAAVFNFLKLEVIVECDEPDRETNWRELILAARRQAGAEDLPDHDSTDECQWMTEIEELSYMILWDADYEDEKLYMDGPPEDDQKLKDFMHIRDDYFLDIAEDPRPEEIEPILTDLKALCRSICEE